MTTDATSPPTQPEPELLGQTVVVIGGSAGIGLETTRRARAEGADVILTGRNPERLNRAALDVDARSSAAFDANDAAALKQFFDGLPDRIDHVMVMAGGPSYGPLLEMDSDQVREAISDHVVLGLEVARNAAGKTRAGGTLLLMGGTGGRRISRDLGIAGGGAKAGRGQARAGARAVAPEGRGDDGDGSPRADPDGHTAGRDRLAAARQHRPLRLDRHYQADWEEMSRYTGRRQYLRSRGHPTWRLVRFVLVKGTREQAQALLERLAGRVEALGLRLKPEKTGVTHIDAGFVFLGQRVIRKPKGAKRYVYTFVCGGAGLGQTEDQGPHRALHDLPGARRPVADAEPDPAGMGRLLPLRLGQAHVRLPRQLRLVARDALASQEAPEADLEAAAAPLLRQERDPGQGDHALQPGGDARRALPLPGRADLNPVERGNRGPDRRPLQAHPPRRSPAPRTPGGGARMTDRHGDAFVESRMRGNSHVRFGGRRRGDHQPKG
jgi:hypothetical protein